MKSCLTKFCEAREVIYWNSTPTQGAVHDLLFHFIFQNFWSYLSCILFCMVLSVCVFVANKQIYMSTSKTNRLQVFKLIPKKTNNVQKRTTSILTIFDATDGVICHACWVPIASRSKIATPPRICVRCSIMPSSMARMVALNRCSTGIALGSQQPENRENMCIMEENYNYLWRPDSYLSIHPKSMSVPAGYLRSASAPEYMLYAVYLKIKLAKFMRERRHITQSWP